MVSQNLAGGLFGHTFAYWEVNGTRQEDAHGIALSSFNAVITGATTAVAYYYPTAGDVDLNGIPDWYEWKYLGVVSNSAASDADGDGFTLEEEYQMDYAAMSDAF